MNRKILAVAITTLLATNVANAAEIYNKDGNKIELKGKVEAAYKVRGHSDFRDVMDSDGNLSDSITRIHHDNEDKTFARLGFHGETQINSELTGYGVFEYEFSPDNRSGSEDDDKTRLAYAGLKFANLGSLDFGRNVGVVEHVRDFTDNAAMFGGDGFGGGADQFLTGRASGVATYTVNDAYGYIDGLNMYLQYQTPNKKSVTEQYVIDRLKRFGLSEENGDFDDINLDEFKGITKDSHGDGLAFTATYEHELGFGGAFTYANSKRTNAQRTLNFFHNGKHAEIWGIAAKYDANNIYAAVSWAESKNMFLIDSGKTFEYANHTYGFEALINYTFDFGLTPSLVYNQLRASELTHTWNPMANTSTYLQKYVGIGAKYAFNKNMDMALGYKINLIDDKAIYTHFAKIASDDQAEMRLTYSF